MSIPVPFSDPPHLLGLPSPYYTDSHRRWQKACRAFIAEHLLPHAMDWEREETVPEHLFETFAKHNMLIPNLPAPLPVSWLKKLGIHDILGVVKVEEWDYMHTGIYVDEMSRSGLAGPGGQFDGGDGVWRAADHQVWEPAAAGAVPARSATGEEEDVYCDYGAHGRERCGEYCDYGDQVKGWEILHYQWNEEVDYEWDLE
jgi:alkylation response protein AidB-like acyl-CoA dehydrogenase